MGEELGDGQIGRRDLLKKGAVAGGLVWASPMVFSSSAGAQVGACGSCDSTRLFGLKFNNPNEIDTLPTGTSGSGNCLTASAQAPDTDCLGDFYTAPKQTGSGDDDDQHTWVLQPGLELCQVAAKVGQGQNSEPPFDSNGCLACPTGGATLASCATSTAGIITVTPTANGGTKVVVKHPDLSHSEILFCYRGSPLACLDAD